VIALAINGLSKTFKGKKGKKVEALAGLDLLIPAGEVFGFLGPNGAGKSTTIKSIMGQIKPSQGNVKIFGIPVGDTNSRMKLGYLPENPAFYDFMTAREYLRFVGNIFGMSTAAVDNESNRVLSLLELIEAADRPIRGYSKGMVQRLGLAQAIIHDPDLYILDEPMSGLDPIGRSLVKEIIKELKLRGKTIFFSTHITSDVELVCDRVGVIDKGKLRAVDSVGKILEQGTEGYLIHARDTDGTIADVFATKENLGSAMEEILASRQTIVSIETKRKDMEAFFLETIAK
jgi:ABC-2 type transport system ATP-binding protein